MRKPRRGAVGTPSKGSRPRSRDVGGVADEESRKAYGEEAVMRGKRRSSGFLNGWFAGAIGAAAIGAGAWAAGAWAAGADAAGRSLSAAEYDRAVRLLDLNIRGTLKGAVVSPRWVGETDSFWYRSIADSGYVLVDAATGRKSVVFDERRLAEAVSGAADSTLGPAAMTITNLEPREDGFLVSASAAGNDFLCAVPSYRCERAATVPVRPEELAAPTGTLRLFARENDLWLRDASTGAERRLTTDGEPWFAYGKTPDTSLDAVVHLRSKAPRPPYGVSWSPDGRSVAGQRLDERAVSGYPFVEWVPQDGSFRPIVYDLRLPLLGDEHQGVLEPFVVNVETGTTRTLALPKGWNLSEPAIAWTKDGERFFGLASTFGDRKAALVEMNARTGAARLAIEEESPTHVEWNAFLYSAPNVRVLADGKRALWFSQRDGWGHLYLYDVARGSLLRRLTKGEWLVRDVIRVDEARGFVYFTATGREPGQDPYFRHLYRVPLEGGRIEHLTPAEGDHEIIGPIASFVASGTGSYTPPSPVSPSGRYVVDSWSTVDRPPVTVIRPTADPGRATEIDRFDASAVHAAGWRAPERFRAKAADGKTDVYGVIYYPPGHSKEGKYPVVDAFYGGPQTINAPRNFIGAVASTSPFSRASLAALGFIVVTIDGRGTPGRSKAFHDVGYGAFADPQIEDHVAVIRALAPGRGFDLDRVGVYGHSFGGYTSARAILSRPDFYKVAVSSAGSHVYEPMYTGLEILLGLPDYGDGATIRPRPDASPEPYRSMDNRRLASNLKGNLLLVYGDMDENALPAATLQLADALVKANRKFDLLYLPNRRHDLVVDPYFVRRMWDYFVEHLLGASPPENYEVKIGMPRPPS
jgi:dipeptidyl aminopeptidase/acylaminoacyl peptidase